MPLRDRRDDIPLLARHFLAREARGNRARPTLSEADLRKLTQYDWPGNVRELQNIIERAVILAQSGRLVIDLPDSEATAGGPKSRRVQDVPPGRILTEAELRELERNNIAAAIVACGGRVSGSGGAAELLGVRPTTLASRIKALEIERPADGGARKRGAPP